MASSPEDKRMLPESIKPYHVFINHRGPDTKNNLASIIYHAFSRSGMNVFFDKEEFVAGQEIPTTIKEAIFSSSVQIAILSPKYAESHWCLEELRLMQITGAKIIPVFYGFLREDLRKQLQNDEGTYAHAFRELDNKMDGNQKRHDSDRIKKWKEAVHKVCDKPGLELNSEHYNGDEGKLVDAIYTQAMKHLSRVWKKSADDLLGLDMAEDEFKDFLEPSEMASSSEDQRPLCGSIDAFISGGSDTKKSLASTIYHEFSRSGVKVFLDKEEFKPKQKLPCRITDAISNSLVQIAILSPKYVESHWCLEELRLMQKTGAKIIPVFYDVPPGDLLKLRKGEGKYADAFSSLDIEVEGNKDIYDKDRIIEWKEAMYKVCNTSGLELNSEYFNGDRGKLVHVIYRRVMEHLRRVWTKSVDGLLGLNKAVDDFKNFLLKVNRKQSERVKIVGIVGTPGSGKTTLAEEFYYGHRRFFDRSSLLLGVRKASQQNGLPALQSQLLKDLTNDCLAISNVSEGKDIIADRVRRLGDTKSLKFLIVIDDVYRQDQLEALLRKEDIVTSGSLIIVTSCNKAVLKLSGISLYYETKPLRLNDAQELLCRSAFHQSQPYNGFEDLIRTALSKSGCFPEFLKTFGENLHLYGNNEKEDWEDVLQMTIPDLFKAICADLEEEERQIFLDIACFFQKIDKNSAIRVWAGSGWRGARALQKLEYMCLVHVDKTTNCLSMPDYLRDLGREIADWQLHKAPDLPYRLWRPNKFPVKYIVQDGVHVIRALWNALQALWNDCTPFMLGNLRHFDERLPDEPLMQAGAKIRGTREASHKQLFERTIEESFTSDSSFKVELLDISGDISSADFSDRLKKLVWLRWENCPETAILPPDMNNLRVLELVNGNLKILRAPDFKLSVELREISIIECTRLVQIPPTIGLLNYLEKMTLNCTISVESLPPEFCQLQALKHLVLRECDCLKSLPDDFGNLTNLQYIDISYCQQLSSLPPSFRQLTRLKTLDVRNCVNLIIQPDIFEDIRSIEELTMENCKKLETLPTQTTLQGLLRKLNLLGTSLNELPNDIDNLTKLQQLKIGSPFLRYLPSSLKNLPSLTELTLLNCVLLTSNPQSYGHLLLSDSSPKKSEQNLVTTLYVYHRS